MLKNKCYCVAPYNKRGRYEGRESEGDEAAGVSLTTHKSGFQCEVFGVLDLYLVSHDLVKAQ